MILGDGLGLGWALPRVWNSLVSGRCACNIYLMTGTCGHFERGKIWQEKGLYVQTTLRFSISKLLLNSQKYQREKTDYEAGSMILDRLLT